MSTHTLARLASIPLLAAGLAACSGGHAPAGHAGAAAASTAGPIAGAIDHALDRAAEKLRSKDLTFTRNGQDVTLSDQGAPPHSGEAMITPKGDLLINGKALALTATQHADVLAYRTQVIDVAQQGIDVGRQGAALGIHAAGDALAMVLSGKSGQQIEARVDKQAAGIKTAASALCKRLPALHASQQKLAAAVPEFRPYASLNQKDVDDCESNAQ